MSWPDPRLNAIQTREDLSVFLRDLSGRLREGRFPVENSDPAAFADAAGRWVRSMDGFFMNRGEEVPASPDWSMIAAVICAGLVYE